MRQHPGTTQASGTTDNAVVSTWVAQGNCLGSFKQILVPGSLPRESGVIALKQALGTGSFESSYNNSSISPNGETVLWT